MYLQNTPLSTKLSAALIFVGMVILIGLIGHEFELYLPDLEIWIEDMGVFAPLGFIFLFVVLAPVLVPIDLLCFAAGVIFPILTGELAIIISTYLASTLIFFLGQDLMREQVLTHVAKQKHFAQLDEIISGDNAFKLMLILRVIPLPFGILSYALSVTKVKFMPYLLATSGDLLYSGALVYLGYTTKHLTGLTGEASKMGFASHSLLVFGLLILLAALVYMANVANDALKQMGMEVPVG
jgi:uncharacterized membrane protein YdjX (TVP38/TMEM64 family)